MSGLNEWGLNHGVEPDIDANEVDQTVPVKSYPDVHQMPEVQAHDLFKEVIPGEVPELKDDLQVIAQEANRIEDLGYVLADLKKLGGMSQAIAQEAMRLDAEFDGGRSLNWYTKQPTATRYKPAMESVLGKIKEVFQHLIKKLRELLRRFALWIVGSRDANEHLMNKSNDQIVKEVEQVAQQQEYRSEEIQQDLRDLGTLAKLVQAEVTKGVDLKDQHGETQHVSDFDKLVAHYLYDTEATDEVRQFMEGRNPIFHDIIEQGPWTMMTEDLVGLVQQALSVMMQKTNVLNGIVASQGSTQLGDQLVQGRSLEILLQRIELNWQGRQQTLQDVADNYNHVYMEASQGDPQVHLSFEQVFTRMADALAQGPTKKLIESGRNIGIRLLTIEKYLDIIETKIGNVITDGAPGMPDHSMAQPMREALDAVRQDVRDLSLIANRMNAYRSIVETMAARVTGFAYRLAVAIYRDLQGSARESHAPEVIQELAKQAEKMRNRHLAAKAKDLFK
ncbi:hypothetical protein [Burkholderia phage FLC9]|nr:hypothetical protein [Burkholderia phage FLC9]